ncbi:cytidine deaminase [Clostridium acetobutylicum]|uniref:Cytidine deaminase family enzyme n=1 Tax=Clostridium acetobutylicum (strain ATCC 824 / DSM 792 / JCM 1419 / IAM 19013 / LMG 5710 / NBRC 13948 / NRRL B-527 / VKM B-1787 / 2291 / W) TaxID=272562 RepID=Q97FW7_CLOAB|nr:MULTISPECIES: cytidine deaminase [Clostridium]AAK80556.1 Cytidine deaminase family enzyme [Clostridium acetobutylicum ATCC 824]ADZ21655.1 Conserved hypothetical protein [Clostridium acetobutylicum EA 2018]AEI32464.1 hypothetical protein SMB_G2644 [Clostridium acetobutylicum DSM 1731]AWV79027.1 cytidine deaminase [Clostridium acetobutylicum]MBC2395013.1 cytidine deaminase [Clostridium acetobutylicum]
MNIFEIDEKDTELIVEAENIINDLYETDKHHIGCAIRTKEGKIITAVHIEAYIGRVTVCAEAIAIGKAISEGIKEFETIVAVRHPAPDELDKIIKVVTPCGMCRELISDYCQDVNVIIPYKNKVVKCKISELLPLKYSR